MPRRGCGEARLCSSCGFSFGNDVLVMEGLSNDTGGIATKVSDREFKSTARANQRLFHSLQGFV